jgi:hypothetical protein
MLPKRDGLDAIAHCRRDFRHMNIRDPEASDFGARRRNQWYGNTVRETTTPILRMRLVANLTFF